MRALLERLLRPGMGTCLACRRPWISSLHPSRLELRIGVFPHVTDYGTNGSHGCFPLCEGCWEARTPGDRVPFYRHLVLQWRMDGSGISSETASDIYAAVWAGG